MSDKHKNNLALFTGKIEDYAKSFISEEIRKVVGAPQNDESDKGDIFHSGLGLVFHTHVELSGAKALFALEVKSGDSSKVVPLAAVDFTALISELDTVLRHTLEIIKLVEDGAGVLPDPLELPLKQVIEVAREHVEPVEKLLGELTRAEEIDLENLKEPEPESAQTDSQNGQSPASENDLPETSTEPEPKKGKAK